MNLPAVRQSAVTFSKAILILAVLVCFAGLAPAAFAQRGGGGHGGGHASGGHVSGSAGHATSGNVSTGSAGRASSGGAARSGSGRAVYASGSSTRGYTRNTFVAGSSSRSGNGVSSFASALTGNEANRTYAANNYFWEDPPQQQRPAAPRPMTPMQMPRPVFAPPLQSPHPFVAPIIAPTGAPLVALPGVIVLRGPVMSRAFDRVSPPLAANRPISSFPRRSATSPFTGMTPQQLFTPGFSPFNPAFRHPIGGCFSAINCGFGFGFGFPFFNPFFPQFGFGFGSPCFAGGFFNPCGGFGLFDWGLGYGYGDGYFYSPAEEPPPPPVNPTEENPPPNYAPDYYFMLPPDEAAAAAPVENKAVVKLELTDGTIFDVYAYWVQDNRLFYITTYNIQTSIPLSDLDLQKTVDLNEKLGVTFTLSNKPPDQQQDQQPPDQQRPDGNGR